MGNEPSKLNSRLGVSAMAFTTTNMERGEFEALADKLKELPDHKICSRVAFEAALAAVPKFEESERDLLLRLFTLYDTAGESVVQPDVYLAGVGGCLCSGTSTEKLAIACKLYDLAGTGILSRADFNHILTAINRVASFFGDPGASAAEIEKCVYATFQHNPEPADPMAIDTAIPHIIDHEVAVAFVRGEGTVRFGRPVAA